jgi:Leucine-rich repeat (LRR) protein
MKSLVSINLDNNAYLRSIQSLNDLPNLHMVRATNCSVTRIPLNLPNMCYLYMSNNKLTSEIYNIKTLTYLDIRNNRFSATTLKTIVAKFNITNPWMTLLY